MSAPAEPVCDALRHHPPASGTVSDTIRQAVALMTKAHAQSKVLDVVNILANPSIYANDAITSIALNGEVLYEGAPISSDTVAREIIDRIAQADPTLYSRTLCVNGRASSPNEFGSYEIFVRSWLASALCGDDVAHCALAIAAMVGKPEWKIFADTATNLRTGRTCPRLARLARVIAATQEVGQDTPLDVACDGVILCDLLCALEATHDVCASGDKGDAGNNSFGLVITADECGAGAVCIWSNAWRLGKTTGDKTVVPDGAVMTTRDVAHALADARANPTGDDMMSVYDKNGKEVARLPEVGSFVEDLIEGASLDACDEHRRALYLMLPLLYGPAARRLRLVAQIADANITVAPTTPVDFDALAYLASLEEALRDQDVAWLRRHIGAHWDEARSGNTILLEGITFAADARGVWRDLYGRTVSWDTFVQTARARGESVAPAVSEPLSWHRMADIESRVAHRDPRYVADMAYGLCCEALRGDTRATDWLRVLSIASPEWAMLNETVAGVVAWVDAECHTADAEPQWSEPLIDWVLDVAPHEDLGARFDGMREAFDTLTMGVITAKGHECMTCVAFDSAAGHWQFDICRCASIYKEDPQRRAACVWKNKHRILVNEKGASPYYVDTYIGAVTRCLTRTPLRVDGRHILAVETFCPLLGDNAHGVEALVRALYTCEPVRTRVIEPAQLVLAERALSTPPA
ncbi:hypothetical protein pneo_cds_764 [Pandoravirus neocaledonia]|uniref:Uncharacterized protein n=1 Tax=Pandoravirus neocaledonia TaxID=2107708 RepID=A0A2U7UD29_9VIRU|nr:hypothetical protein pneo_cds_764 [Pandoravirus neocaledonia]AVK76371.1 hypothetical protein pneo_cds_764 [Pandoravirus neocaledonia]